MDLNHGMNELDRIKTFGHLIWITFGGKWFKYNVVSKIVRIEEIFFLHTKMKLKELLELDKETQ
jgi:hypothetical protein